MTMADDNAFDSLMVSVDPVPSRGTYNQVHRCHRVYNARTAPDVESSNNYGVVREE